MVIGLLRIAWVKGVAGRAVVVNEYRRRRIMSDLQPKLAARLEGIVIGVVLTAIVWAIGPVLMGACR